MQAVSPRVLSLAATFLIATSVVRVASVPSTTSSQAPHTLWSAVDEARTEIGATVVGLRREILRQEATYSKMWTDTRELQERLEQSAPSR